MTTGCIACRESQIADSFRRMQEECCRCETRLHNSPQAARSTSSTHKGTSPLAGPIRLSWNQDRKSVVSGKSAAVRVDLGGRRICKQTNSPRNPTKNVLQL